jgi:hypothetical protein
MLIQTIADAQQVNATLHQAETNMDSTIDSVARCLSRMVRARQRGNLPLYKGQDALDAMVQSLSSLTAARREMIVSHASLRDLADDLGIPAQAFGDFCPIPEGGEQPHGSSAGLRVVA